MRAELAAVCALLLALSPALADVVVSEGTNLSVDVADDGRIAIDLLDSLWIRPPEQADLMPVDTGVHTVRRPRFSPDGGRIAFDTGAAETAGLRILTMNGGAIARVGDERFANRDPDWHPDGERIVFSSARGEDGFDLYEVDIATGLEWRLSGLPGDETEPAWSQDGRNLVYIRHSGTRWSLMLRRFGMPDEALVTSTVPIAAPSWRPDGSLITWLTRENTGWSAWMTILSQPRLHRRLLTDDDLFLSPFAWPDRHTMVYAANGHIRTRQFDAWSSQTIPFRARIGEPAHIGQGRTSGRELPDIERPTGRTVIRAARVFDGLGEGYRQNVDVVADDGVITGLEPRRERSDGIVVDLGDLTLLPGLVDAYASLPDAADITIGPLLLALGVTTLVADHPRAEELNIAWSGKVMPGPRLLRASSLTAATPGEALPWLISFRGGRAAATNLEPDVREWQERGVPVLADSWQAAVATGASLVLGVDSAPASPAGRRYEDLELAGGAGELTLVSGLADAATPGIAEIRRSRVAALLPGRPPPARRASSLPNLARSAPTVVAGSFPNGLPAGAALHAELRALVAAGLSPAESLKAAGVNAARALGLGLSVGRIAPGAEADLVVVDGDPLEDVGDALAIVGIVRNGRFYSVSGLLDRAGTEAIVE